MDKINVKNILEITKGILISGNENEICKKFSKDTRTISNNDIYIGIKGEKFDGNLFWKEALLKGAKGVIVQDVEFSEEDLENFREKIIIKVNNTLHALYDLAKYKRKQYNVPVIAITGSVGKTSTKDIIASVVSQKYKTLKTIGNNNNNIGLPMTILNADEDIEAMVLEMGMNHFGEIKLLSQIAKPNICVITNIGTSHIGNLGSRENILKAKLEILEGAETPYIIINNDNDLLSKWYNQNKDGFDIVTYGIDNKSDIMPVEIEMMEDKSKFTITLNNEINKITVNVGGKHFITNSLCAIAVGLKLNIENNKIKQGIETFQLTKNRMEIIELKNGIKIINDAYNSSVESVEASLKYLKNIKECRKIAILGDVLETGEFEQKIHEKIGEIVVENNVDILICNGKASQYIIERVKKLGFNEKDLYYFDDRKEIVNLVKKIVKPKDVILIKASNGMKFFEISEELNKYLK